MIRSQLSRIAVQLESSSDFGLYEVMQELRSLVDQVKADGNWEVAKTWPEADSLAKALMRKHAAASDENVGAACLLALDDLEMVAETEFVIASLASATQRLKRVDRHLFAAVRLALSAGLLSDEEYLDAVGGPDDSAMSLSDIDKHIRVSEKILHTRGIPTSVI
jgi:hypothetical protein